MGSRNGRQQRGTGDGRMAREEKERKEDESRGIYLNQRGTIENCH